MSDSNKNFVLVTGAAGFIGSRVAESCRQQGLAVLAVDQEGFFQDRPEHLPYLKPERVVDMDQLFDVLKSGELKGKIASIIHMGACTDTTELNEEFLRRVNIEYSKTLWNYATQEKIPFVYASSAATYGDGALGYKDDESQISKLKPLNPYGESKRLFDIWALEQEKLGKTPPVWAGFKFFNVYGFGERHKGKMASVVMHSFDQISAGQDVRLFKSHRDGISDGEQKRDFVFVDDVVEVLQFARKGGIKRGIYNLGSGKARSFHDLARATFRALGKPEQIRFIDMPVELRERYQYFTEAQMSKLQSAGYTKPFTTLEDGVAKYVARLK